MATADRIGGAGGADRAHRIRARRCAWRSRHRSRSCPAGSRAAPATRAAGTPCRACRAADRDPGRGPRRSRPPARRSSRTPRRRRSVAALGKRSCSSRTSASGSSPSRIAQTPLPVIATRIEPSEHSPTANRISASTPPSRYACRRHAQQLVRGLVEAPARVEAGAIDRPGDAAALRQLVAHARAAMRGGIVLRRDAGDRL